VLVLGFSLVFRKIWIVAYLLHRELGCDVSNVLCISKKNRQRNGQKDKQKDKQWPTKHTYKTKERVTRTPLTTGVNSGAPEGWAVHAQNAFDAICTCVWARTKMTLIQYLCELYVYTRQITLRCNKFQCCVVCPSPIYRFWFPLWCLQTPLTYENPSQPNN
jgi:hypothetical protein